MKLAHRPTVGSLVASDLEHEMPNLVPHVARTWKAHQLLNVRVMSVDHCLVVAPYVPRASRWPSRRSLLPFAIRFL